MSKDQRIYNKNCEFTRNHEQRTRENPEKNNEKMDFGHEQRTRHFSDFDDDYLIGEFVDQFYISLRTNERSKYTIHFYQDKLSKWINWCEEEDIIYLSELKPNIIREFLAQYRENHTVGGAHSYYRAIRAYLNWVWNEYDIEAKNPISKVKCSNRQVEPIPGVQAEDVDKLFSAAKQGKMPLRDCAILAILLDTGIRRSSLHAIQKQDVDVISGCIYIRHSKNKKPTTVYLGNVARKHVRKYMRSLPSYLPDDSTIWFNQDGTPLTINSFGLIINRITKRAGVESYSLHDFRRYFALESYRNGADIFAVSALLDHSGIEVTRRYLAIDEDDKRAIHNKISPLDRK